MFDCPQILNIRHLRMVQTIAEVGGVTCAARALNTSQPAVTQAVLNLEATLGVDLFQRYATGTVPTEAGRVLLVRVRRFFQILDRAMMELPGACGEAPLPVEQRVTATHIRALILTAEPSTVEENATRHRLAPSTLYRSVRDLERHLGHRLFRRSGDRPVCNQLGQALVREFRRALREVEFARGELNIVAGSGDVKIVLGALPMAGSSDVATALREMRVRRPDAQVQVIEGDYHSLLDDLRNCRIDMIYGLLRRPDWVTDVEEEVFFNDELCIAARKGHPVTRMNRITPEALARFDWVVPATGTPRRTQIERLFADLPRPPHFGIETSSLATLRALLCNSDMITILPRSEMALDVAAGLLTGRACHLLEALPPKGMTTRADWLPTEAHANFIDFLRKATATAAPAAGVTVEGDPAAVS